MYNKQIFKTSLAQRVVDKKNPQRHAQRNMLAWLFEPKKVAHDDLQQWKGKDTAVLDKIIDAQSRQTQGDESGRICKIQTMEVLQTEEAEVLDELAQLEVEQELAYNKNARRGRNAAPLDSMAANGFAPMPSTAPAYSGPSTAAATGNRPSPTMSRLQRPVLAAPPSATQAPAQPRESNLPARDIRNQAQMGAGLFGSATQGPGAQQQQQRRPYLGGLPHVRREGDT